MAKIVTYGEAQAGTYTGADLCGIGWSKWLCSGSDGAAWWAATQLWVSFVALLTTQLANLEPLSAWPQDILGAAKLAEITGKKYADDHPWLMFESDIAQYAEEQQLLRDIAGQLATRIVALGGTPPPAPGQLKTESSSGKWLAVGLVGGVGLAVLVAWGLSKKKNERSLR